MAGGEASPSPPPPRSARRLVLHSAHAIAYGRDGARERALALHVDDSLVTATLCLGVDGFEGPRSSSTGAIGSRTRPCRGRRRGWSARRRVVPAAAARASRCGGARPSRSCIDASDKIQKKYKNTKIYL